MMTRGGHAPKRGPNDREEIRRWFAAEDPWAIYSENRAARQRVIELIAKNPRSIAAETPGERPAAPPAVPALKRLQEITIPALVLVGEFDHPDVHAHAGAICAGMPNATRDIVPRAAHLIPMEQPALFNDAVQAFLDRVGYRGAAR